MVDTHHGTELNRYIYVPVTGGRERVDVSARVIATRVNLISADDWLPRSNPCNSCVTPFAIEGGPEAT